MSTFVKPLTKILGIVFVIIGVAGFFVDGTLIVFEVDMMHNIVHIVTGLVAFAAASNYSYARMFLIIFGLVYGVVTVMGFMSGDVFGLFHVNEADNYLHLITAAVCLGVGLGSKSKG